MKIEDELKAIFISNSNLFPVGYQYLILTEIEMVVGRIGVSKTHNSDFYFLTDFYKPTSIIFSNDQR